MIIVYQLVGVVTSIWGIRWRYRIRTWRTTFHWFSIRLTRMITVTVHAHLAIEWPSTDAWSWILKKGLRYSRWNRYQVARMSNPVNSTHTPAVSHFLLCQSQVLRFFRRKKNGLLKWIQTTVLPLTKEKGRAKIGSKHKWKADCIWKMMRLFEYVTAIWAASR